MKLQPDGDVPNSEGPPLSTPRLRAHLAYGLLVLASIWFFSGPLRQWISLALSDPRYSHIALAPAISAFVLYLERQRVFAGRQQTAGVNEGAVLE